VSTLSSPNPPAAGGVLNPEPDSGPALAPNRWPALLLLLAGLAATALATRLAQQDVTASARIEFEFAGHEIAIKVKERLQDHEQILRSGAALFAASEKVTRANWRNFFEHLQVDNQLPGILGLGYARLIPPERLAQHLQEIRQEGFPDYHVWPEGERAVYTAIIYLEPFTNRNLRAFGYDMLSEPTRRVAMERARDDNAAALTGKVKLVQETVTDVQAGTLMYVPVYRRGMPVTTAAERRGALQGWVYSPYRMKDLMQGILGEWESLKGQRIRLQVFDGAETTADARLYDSRAASASRLSSAAGFTLQTPITCAGRRWTLLLTQGRISAGAPYNRVWVAAAAGAALSLLLAGLVHSLRNTRYRAQRMAERLTADLQHTTERLALATEAGGVGIWDYEVTTNTLVWDDQMFRLYGVTRARFSSAYEAWLGGVHPEDRQRGDAEIQSTLRGEKEFNTEFRVLWPDGTVRHIRAVAHLQRNPAGQPVRLLGTNWDITALKETEESLREITLFLQETQRIARLSGWKANPHTDYLEWTAGVFEIIEAPQTIQPGLTEGLKFYLPEYIPILRDNITRCLVTGEQFAMECQGITGTGKPIWTEVRGLAPMARRGNAYVMGTFQDITARKQVEAALRESEANFRTFFESMTDLIFVATPDGRIIFTNATATRTLGYSAEKLATMHALELYPADRRQEAGNFFAAMFRGERAVCPLPLACEDGELTQSETRVWLGRWNGANALFGISKNLTSEADAHQRFERLFRGNPTLIALSTLPDQRFFDVNDAFLRVLGFLKDEVVGKTAADLGLFLDPEQQAAVAAQLMKDGQIANFELQVRRKDKSVLDSLFSGEVISSQGQQYFLTVMIDITERKRVETELLRTLIAERELVTLKNTFVSMVSHEFRTPLSAILGAAEMLEDFYDRLAPEKRADYFLMIRREIERLTAMLQDVLLQGQLEAGRIQFQPRSTDVVALCREVVARTQTAFPKHPPVHFEADAPAGRALADGGLLEPVLSNLLSNAFKYSPALTPVHFTVRRVGKEWEIQVRDQGIGIPEADQAALFSAFRRGGNVGSIKGTGVGLYVVKKCAELHGGRVELRSQAGQGSTFVFAFPWQPAEPAPTATP